MGRIWSAVLSLMMITGSFGAEPEEPKIRTLAKGAFSGIEKATELVVTNSTQWAEVWKKHSAQQQPAKALPEVDFKTNSVVLVALGRKPTGGYAVEVSDVRSSEGKTEILVKTRAPKPGGIQLQALSAPFHIVAVPKISGPVKFKYEP
jgi:hypothetical protein